jgi:orotate phosphoribosyltransferase
MTGREIAELLLDAKAFSLSVDVPYVWSSGMHAPLYCDHRALLAHVGTRRRISDALATVVHERFGDAQAVAGVAQAAVPYAAWVADLLELPLLFVRREPKGHGHQRQVEGVRDSIDKVVIVEDVVSTGASVFRVADALRGASLSIAGVVAILDYQISGGALERAGLPFAALYTFKDLRAALEGRGLERDELELLDEWHLHPWCGEYVPTHSAGGVVLNVRGEVLVVNQEGTTWSLPKGHLQSGEQPLAAARREIAEESGLEDLQLVGELGSYSRFAHGTDGSLELKTITMFLFTSAKEVLQPRDPDNPQARWVVKDEVAELLSNPVDKAFFRRIRNRL